MAKLNMYCLTLDPSHLPLIKKLEYIPVGLGEARFDKKEWTQDCLGNNIAEKNKYYGEYTFHYYLWKNNILDYDGWTGFCQYRKFWKKNSDIIEDNSFNNLKENLLKEIPSELENYETIIGEELFINKFRFSKFIKHNFKKMLFSPHLFINKEKRNIKFHFNMMHGEGNLDKAISLLDVADKSDFSYFINSEVSFNPHNMFICKNKNILFSYYNSLFPWLKKCEKIFGFESLKGFGLQRIYGFLAERYMSYWFKKYTKYFKLPIHFKNLDDFRE